MSRGQLPSGPVLYLFGTVYFGTVHGGVPDNWQLQLDFPSKLLAAFSIGQNDTRVAALVFSEEVTLDIPLNKFNSLSEIQETILYVPYLGQTTNTPEALHQADSQCFSAVNGGRDDADNVVIIVTDGVPFPPDRRNPALREARRLKEKGIRIAAVGITDGVDEEFLRGISSGDNYFTVPEFQELERQVEQISEQICQVAPNGKSCCKSLHQNMNI